MHAKHSTWPLRRAFERADVSVFEVARRMGKDEMQIRRLLGRVQETRLDGSKYTQQTCKEVTAVAFINALGLDPVDVGI